MKELNFNDRLTYLAWRAEWKAQYKQLSTAIRSAKNAYKTEQRRVVVGIVNEGKSWQCNVAYIDGQPLSWKMDYYTVFRDWNKLRQQAREMLDILGKAKEKSSQQRRESLVQTS